MKWKIKIEPDEVYKGWNMFFEYEDKSTGMHTNGPSEFRARCVKDGVEFIVNLERVHHRTRMTARKEIDKKELI